MGFSRVLPELDLVVELILSDIEIRPLVRRNGTGPEPIVDHDSVLRPAQLVETDSAGRNDGISGASTRHSNRE